PITIARPATTGHWSTGSASGPSSRRATLDTHDNAASTGGPRRPGGRRPEPAPFAAPRRQAVPCPVMSKRDAFILRATALWSFFVWGVLIRNMLKDHDHGVAFRAVHIVLAIISIAFGIAVLMVASRGRKRADAAGRDQRERV